MGNIKSFHGKGANSFITSNIISHDRKTQMLREEIKKLLADRAFDKRFIMNHVLNKICLITGSEYGCICRVTKGNDEREINIYRYATTNIAWNTESDMYFKSNNRIKNSDDSKQSVNVTFIDNEYEDSRYRNFSAVRIKRYMSVPCSFNGDTSPCTIYLCNKLTEFRKKDALRAKSVLDVVSHLLI